MLDDFSTSQRAELHAALFLGKKALAIKTHGAAVSASLRDAILAVDKREAEPRVRFPERFKQEEAPQSAPATPLTQTQPMRALPSAASQAR
jgi:fatty acid/phospholipid biosynthesis enzyme